MSVTSPTNKVRYACNGVTVAFAVPFVFTDATDLIVLKVDASGGETVLTLNVDYTVSGGSGSTGTVTTTTAYSSVYTLCIWRQPAYTQSLDLAEGGAFAAASIENALDKATELSQAILNRMIAIRRGGSLTGPIELPALPTVDSTLGWNATSGGFQWIAGATPATSAQFDSIGNYASLNAAITAFGANQKTLLVDVNSTVATNTSVPANVCLMFINGAKLTINNGVTLTIAGQVNADPNQQIFVATGTVTFSNAQWVSPQWWGAKCDGVTDDATAMNAALASGGSVKMTAGSYVLGAIIKIPSNGTLVGEGRKTILIKPSTFVNDFGSTASSAWITNSDRTNGNTNIYIGNFTISNNSTYTGGTNHGGIWFVKLDTFLVDKIYTSAWLDISPITYEKGCKRGITINCDLRHPNTITGAGSAIGFRSGITTDGTGASDIFDMVVSNCYLEASVDETLALFAYQNYMYNIVVTGNIIKSTGTPAYLALSTGHNGSTGFSGYLKNAIIANNYISGKFNVLPGTNGLIFDGNQIVMEKSNAVACINITTTAGTGSPDPKNIQISNNTIIGDGVVATGKRGIDINAKGTGYLRIYNNTITNMGQHAIYLANVTNIDIVGNHLSTVTGASHAINMTTTTDTNRILIEGNSIEGVNGIVGFSSAGGIFSNITLRNNNIFNVSGTAISFNIGTSATCFNLFIENNRMEDTVGTMNGVGITTNPDFAGGRLLNNVYYGTNTDFSLGATALSAFTMRGNLFGVSATNNFPRAKGTTAQRPTLGAVMANFTYIDTDLGVPIWWNGSAWIRYDGVGV